MKAISSHPMHTDELSDRGGVPCGENSRTVAQGRSPYVATPQP